MDSLLAEIEALWPTRYPFPREEIINKLADVITWPLPLEADEDYAYAIGVEWDENALSTAMSQLTEVLRPYLSPDFFSRDNRVEEHFRWDALYQDCLLYTSPSPRDS